jgi:hypothetical protein
MIPNKETLLKFTRSNGLLNTDHPITQGEKTGEQINNIMALMVSKSNEVKKLIDASFLKDRIKRSYLQTYQLKLKKLGE